MKNEERTMHTMRCLAALSVIAITMAMGCSQVNASKDDRNELIDAVIVFARPLPETRVGEMDAIHVADPGRLAELEGFFPNYRKRPTNNRFASWKTGYTVYFNFRSGETIRVTVAGHGEDGMQLWCVSRGDFETQGDFLEFMDRLRPKR